jgi:hypothetical protein
MLWIVSPTGHLKTIGAGPLNAPVNLGVSAQSTVGRSVGDGGAGGKVDMGAASQLHPTVPREVSKTAEALGKNSGQKAASGLHFTTLHAADLPSDVKTAGKKMTLNL